jgi:hypothetical protein
MDISDDDKEPHTHTRILWKELTHLQKTKMPEQRIREQCCTFYVKNPIYIMGSKVSKRENASHYVEYYSKVNELLSSQYYIYDYPLSSIKIVNEMEGAYTCIEHQKDAIDKKLGLYKSLPYYHLHQNIKKHLQLEPEVIKKLDFNKIAYFQIHYYGSEKPGVYELHVKKGSKTIRYGIAYVPTLEIQQYLVHLLKTRGTSKPIVLECAYCEEKKKWTPIHFHIKRKEPDRIEKIQKLLQRT